MRKRLRSPRRAMALAALSSLTLVGGCPGESLEWSREQKLGLCVPVAVRDEIRWPTSVTAAPVVALRAADPDGGLVLQDPRLDMGRTLYTEAASDPTALQAVLERLDRKHVRAIAAALSRVRRPGDTHPGPGESDGDPRRRLRAVLGRIDGAAVAALADVLQPGRDADTAVILRLEDDASGRRLAVAVRGATVVGGAFLVEARAVRGYDQDATGYHSRVPVDATADLLGRIATYSVWTSLRYALSPYEGEIPADKREAMDTWWRHPAGKRK